MPNKSIADTSPGASGKWQGRFPFNEIISLLDVNRPFNLAESTSQDLTVGEILDIAGIENIRSLKLGYGASAGLITLRHEVAKSCRIPVEQVITTQGTALGLFLIAFEACRPGDEAILVTPCFPPSRDSLLGAGVNVREIRLSFDSRYGLDLDQFAATLSPGVKLVSVASPQNPSGIQVSRATIVELLTLMERLSPEAILFIDETYREATYGSAVAVPSLAGLHPRVVTGASVSKALGAPGLRAGWLTVADADLRKRLAVAKMNTVICNSVLDETLAAALLRNKEAVLAPRRQLLAAALETLAAWHEAERDRVAWVRPDAGALCCMRLSADAFDDPVVEQFWSQLPRHDLQLACGTWFGETSRVFRLGFGYLPPARLAPALSALSSALSGVTA